MKRVIGGDQVLGKAGEKKSTRLVIGGLSSGRILGGTDKRGSLIAQGIDRIHAACTVRREPNGQ
jgi:hypothetical protein